MNHPPDLKPCPYEGEGVHKWTYYAACTCVEAGMSDEEAEWFIEERMTRDPNPASEVEDALASARGERRRLSFSWSRPNQTRIAAIAKNGPTLVELVRRSPQPIQFGARSRSEEIIHTLFPGNPLLCLGKAPNDTFTMKAHVWRRMLQSQSVMVPAPMSAERGRTKQGKISYRSEANTGPRRFLITEFDQGSLDQQSALLWHLQEFAPLALVVFSGSKSAHGWFFCEGQPEDKLRRFFDYAVSLGADSHMWTRCQVCRVPDGTRYDGKTGEALVAAGIGGVPTARQAVLYFNPEVI